MGGPYYREPQQAVPMTKAGQWTSMPSPGQYQHSYIHKYKRLHADRTGVVQVLLAQSALRSVTEMRILLMAAKWGRDVLFFMLNTTQSILLVSVVKGALWRSPGAPTLPPIGMQNRTFGPCLAAINRNLNSVMQVRCT
jgi:hypothetical protein